MNEPPMMLDGARVVEFATIDGGMAPSGRASFVVGGVPSDLDNVAGIVIAEDLVDGGAYLLLCNKRWETLAAGHHAGVVEAEASIAAAFSELGAKWTRFRELTQEEAREVATTQAFLRQLAADN